MQWNSAIRSSEPFYTDKRENHYKVVPSALNIEFLVAFTFFTFIASCYYQLSTKKLIALTELYVFISFALNALTIEEETEEEVIVVEVVVKSVQIEQTHGFN